MGKTPYQKQAAKQKKAAKKTNNKPKKKIGKAIAITLAIVILLVGINFGVYALTTNNPISLPGYANHVQQVLILEETVEERDSLQEQLATEQERTETLEAEKATLQAEIADKTAQIATKDAQITANLATIATLEAEAVVDAGTIATLETANQTLTTEKTALQASVDALTADLELVNGQLAAANSTIATLETELADKDAQILDLQATIATLEAAIQETVYMQDQELGTYSALNFDGNAIPVEVVDMTVTATITDLGNDNYRVNGQWDALSSTTFEFSYQTDPNWLESKAFFLINGLPGQLQLQNVGHSVDADIFELLNFIDPANYNQTLNLTAFLNLWTEKFAIWLQIPFTMNLTLEQEQAEVQEVSNFSILGQEQSFDINDYVESHPVEIGEFNITNGIIVDLGYGLYEFTSDQFNFNMDSTGLSGDELAVNFYNLLLHYANVVGDIEYYGYAFIDDASFAFSLKEDINNSNYGSGSSGGQWVTVGLLNGLEIGFWLNLDYMFYQGIQDKRLLSDVNIQFLGLDMDFVNYTEHFFELEINYSEADGIADVSVIYTNSMQELYFQKEVPEYSSLAWELTNENAPFSGLWSYDNCAPQPNSITIYTALVNAKTSGQQQVGGVSNMRLILELENYVALGSRTEVPIIVSYTVNFN